MSLIHWLLAVPAFVLVYVLAAVFFLHATRAPGAADWRTASRAPVGLAPDPAQVREAVVQVYAARALSWRGYFAVHPWIAVKRAGARTFTVYEVNGWRLWQASTCAMVSQRPPDARWFGNAPQLLADRRGAGVDALIDRIEEGVEVNLLGLTFGLDPRHLAVKLPLLGSFGPRRFANAPQEHPPLEAPDTIR